MLGTIVNVVAIVVGAFLGRGLERNINEDYKNTIMDGISLSVLIIGIGGALKSDNLVLVIGSLVIGSIIGEAIDIERRLDHLGQGLEKKFAGQDQGFSQAFVSTSLIYCIGAMAIVGSIESGISGNHQTLFAKSILDGITAIIFSSTMGIGVAFSALAVLIYQGIITLMAVAVKSFLTDPMITEMSAVGGILIMGIGVNMMGMKKIKIGNMLPAIFLPVIYYLLVGLIAI